VRVEFGYLLATSQGSIWLKTACEDGLLTTWFPNTTSDRLDLLATVDRSGELLAETWPELRQLLSTWIEKTIKTSWLAIAKLATLVDPDTAEAELLHLKYSRVEIKAAIAILKYLPKLSSPIAVREQYFLFRELGFVFPSLAVVAVANGIELATVAPLIDCYLNPEDRVAHPIQLVSGKDLMSALNLPAGRQIGELISEIQVAQAEGRISSYEEALELAANLL
jgi:tRNA nucleotidyltransferase (CCA-adding enzyme)